MNEPRKSDSLVVPMKAPNKAAQPAAEAVEGRGEAKGTCASKTRLGLSAGKARSARWSEYVGQHRAAMASLPKARAGCGSAMSGSMEGAASNHGPYSDCLPFRPLLVARVHGGQGRPPYCQAISSDLKSRGLAF